MLPLPLPPPARAAPARGAAAAAAPRRARAGLGWGSLGHVRPRLGRLRLRLRLRLGLDSGGSRAGAAARRGGSERARTRLRLPLPGGRGGGGGGGGGSRGEGHGREAVGAARAPAHGAPPGPPPRSHAPGERGREGGPAQKGYFKVTSPAINSASALSVSPPGRSRTDACALPVVQFGAAKVEVGAWRGGDCGAGGLGAQSGAAGLWVTLSRALPPLWPQFPPLTEGLQRRF
ncbi:translation initiation factor IF-2-like [Dromiciops gliroides]|uniref:translation initiation factor IF-2-like n=1 Tax=Dromiciops gliroides TaxID=33562 RepID=UPI001CC5388E|nr:translation initiation factor IF-2-like [Dromiciops gliroides]